MMLSLALLLGFLWLSMISLFSFNHPAARLIWPVPPYDPSTLMPTSVVVYLPAYTGPQVLGGRFSMDASVDRGEWKFLGSVPLLRRLQNINLNTLLPATDYQLRFRTVVGEQSSDFSDLLNFTTPRTGNALFTVRPQRAKGYAVVVFM